MCCRSQKQLSWWCSVELSRVSTVDFVDVKYPDENYPGCKYLGPENRIVFRKFYVTVEACTL